MRRFTTGFQTPSNKQQYSVSRPTMSSVAKSATKTSAYPGDRYTVGAVPSSSVKRASSFFRSATTTYTETRNLKDHEVQSSMKAKMIEFLLANEFPYPNVEKMVRSPTRTDFTRIFEFTYQQLDHRYALRGKLEDEMPRIFQLLGYPVPLKPSTMQTIGAAHTMHILLGAMTWLIDVVTIASGLQPQDLLLESDESDGQRTSLGYGYVVKAYQKMRQSGGQWSDAEGFKEETANLIQIIEEKDDLSAISAELQAKQELVEEERQQLLKDQGEAAKLQDELETAKKDLRSYKEYKEQLLVATTNMANEKETVKKELESLIAKVEAMRSESTEILSAQQARELNTRRTELKGSIKQMSDDLESLEKEICALQTDLFKEGTRLREQYTAMVKLFDEQRRSFDATDDSFVLEMQDYSPNAADFLKFAETIKENIEALRNFIQQTLCGLDDEKCSIECEIEKLRSTKESKKAMLDVLKRKLQQKEHEQALKREDWADEKGKAALRLDVAQNEVQGLKELRSNTLDAHEELAKVKKEQQTQQLKIEAMMKDVVLDVTRKLSGVVQLCDRVREGRRALRQDEASLRAAVERHIEQVKLAVATNQVTK